MGERPEHRVARERTEDEQALPFFACPHCGAVSYHPKDVEHQYCGRCHWWTGVPALYLPWRLEREAADITVPKDAGP